MSESKGKLWWPEELSVPGSKRSKILEPGEILNRYTQIEPVYDEGNWLEPDGTPKDSRLFNIFNTDLKLRRFKLLKPLHVEASNALSWFDMKGLGRQYRITEEMSDELQHERSMHIRDLILNGFMVEIDESEHEIATPVSDYDIFCEHWQLDKDVRTVSSYQQISQMDDGVYVDSEHTAIFMKHHGMVAPVCSYRRDYYLLQLLHFQFLQEDLEVSHLEEKDFNAVKYVLYPVEKLDDFTDILSEIAEVFHLEIDSSKWKNDITQWCSGDISTLDQIYTIDQVTENEYRILFWERGKFSEIVRICGEDHLYEYLLNYYCHWI